MCQCCGMETYTKYCNAWSALLEISNCDIVCNRGFSPPHIAGNVQTNTVTTTLGVPLDVFVQESCDADAIVAVRSGMRVLRQMHQASMLHLDARACNFILSIVPKANAVRDTYTDGVVRYCYAIDFESLWAMPQYNQNVSIFNREACAMRKYGRLQHAAYLALSDASKFKFDVHALAQSIAVLLPCTLLGNACTRIVNHVPQEVSGMSRDMSEHTWTEYLIDITKPVLSSNVAISTFSQLLVTDVQVVPDCRCF